MQETENPATIETPSVLSQTLHEVTQPFIDLFHASQALWGINLSYLLEGLTYFGVVGLLAIFFNDYIGLDDISAGQMVGFLTAGITLGMLFMGATVDVIGPRRSLLASLVLMLIGRTLLTLSPDLGTKGLWSSSHWMAMGGLLGIILGYGIYQPACYAAVRQFTSEKTAAMGYAMLYALMNLGGFLPGLVSPPVRHVFGITGVFWVYVALTVAGILVIALFLTRKAVDRARAQAALERKEEPVAEEKKSAKEQLLYYLRNFPLKDGRFMFFIFILIPVQTLFAHNWLTLPQYCNRAFTGLVSDNYEFFVNFSPILIFILTPVVTALTAKKDTYTMMIIGTFVMAAPTFILALGPNIVGLFAYLILATLGEATWSARFLQWVAEIAPKNMTGIYMGIGQFPWFLTKVITSLYSGWFLMHYCPAGVPPSETHTETMWFIYGVIAIMTPVGLVLASNWMRKGFKVRHEG
ncbi:MAG TPA: MFS transporter [Bacteroidota bacterium]|nr:MFS transporter [Bacteroidota bacterium]